MELDQRMSFVEVVVVVLDCRKFVVPLLVLHSCPVKQRKVLLVEGYMRFVEQLQGPHMSLMELRLLLDCQMFVERMQVPHNYLVELMVVDCKMFVEQPVELHRSLVEEEGRQLLEELHNHHKMVALLLALVVPCKLVFAVVSILDWKVPVVVQVD